MTGAVLGSGLGLYGFRLQESLWGALAGLQVVGGVYAIGRYLPDRLQLPIPPAYEMSLRDELRWALYRGAAASWLGEIWMGGLIGWGLAAVEWLLADQPWNEAGWKDPEQWTVLVRAVVSAGLYMISRNLWLVLSFQLLALWVWRLEPKQVGLDEGDED
jgi:hypothetical protein